MRDGVRPKGDTHPPRPEQGDYWLRAWKPSDGIIACGLKRRREVCTEHYGARGKLAAAAFMGYISITVYFATIFFF